MRKAAPFSLVVAALTLWPGRADAQTRCCLDALGYYASSGACVGRDPGMGSGWPADPQYCTRPYCFDPIAQVGWRPTDRNDFTCNKHTSSWMITKEQYDDLIRRGRVRQ